MEKLKSKLCEKLSESVLVDEELKKLESRSDSLHELRRTSMNTTTSSSQKQEVIKEEQLDEKLHRLEREKEDILNNLFQSCRLPDGFQLHSRISIYSSEVKACDSILKQTEKCLQSYRQALQLLRIGLSTIVSPNYTASVKEFIRDPYPLAIEAGHLIEAASHCIQPESHRRYRTFAPELTNVKLPKFPQAIVDYAKRIRTNIDSHSTLAMESTRKLRTAENIVIVMQRLVIEKLELIEKWQQQIQKDRNQALEAHQKCESKLKTQIAVLAHTVSA
jgi:hypothetical protein